MTVATYVSHVEKTGDVAMGNERTKHTIQFNLHNQGLYEMSYCSRASDGNMGPIRVTVSEPGWTQAVWTQEAAYEGTEIRHFKRFAVVEADMSLYIYEL